jgi:hypothetical protein
MGLGHRRRSTAKGTDRLPLDHVESASVVFPIPPPPKITTRQHWTEQCINDVAPFFVPSDHEFNGGVAKQVYGRQC